MQHLTAGAVEAGMHEVVVTEAALARAAKARTACGHALCCIVLYCHVLCCSVLYCLVLLCIVVYCFLHYLEPRVATHTTQARAAGRPAWRISSTLFAHVSPLYTILYCTALYCALLTHTRAGRASTQPRAPATHPNHTHFRPRPRPRAATCRPLVVTAVV